MDPVTGKTVIDKHILAALAEDMNAGDVSTDAVMPNSRHGSVQLIAKADGVIAGLDVFARTFILVDPQTQVTFSVCDGDEVSAGQVLGTVSGDVRVLLSAERTALNYLQRMSGIATYTRRMVRALEGTGVTLVDTRKTTPTLRIFEKTATRAGGAVNHRFNLSDGVMLKDNHIAAAGGIAKAVAAARARASFTSSIEVETETLDQVREALSAGADIIMLDNMDAETMRQAVKLVDGRAIVEASGNFTVDNIGQLRGTGVDVVSSGAITHSAGILDLSMKNLMVDEGEDADEEEGAEPVVGGTR